MSEPVAKIPSKEQFELVISQMNAEVLAAHPEVTGLGSDECPYCTFHRQIQDTLFPQVREALIDTFQPINQALAHTIMDADIRMLASACLSLGLNLGRLQATEEMVKLGVEDAE